MRVYARNKSGVEFFISPPTEKVLNAAHFGQPYTYLNIFSKILTHMEYSLDKTL